MKNLTCLLMLFALGTTFAGEIPDKMSLAREVAEKFYKQSSQQELTALTLAHTEKTSGGKAIFYVFNINENEGYIVVNTDLNVPLIMDYSTEGQYTTEQPEKGVVTIEKWDPKSWAATF